MQKKDAKTFSKIKGYSKEGFWIILGQVVSILGSLASVKVLTNYLAPSEYGDLYLSLTVVAFGAQIVFGPINQSSLRYYSPSVESRKFKLFNKVTLYYYKWAFYIIGLFLVIGLWYVLYSEISEKWAILLILASIYAVLNGVNTNLDQIQNAARQRIIVAWHNGISSWLRVLFAYLFIIIFYNNAIVAMCGFIVSHSIVYGSQQFFFRTKIKNKLIKLDKGHNQKDEIKLRKKFIEYGWPFAAWGIFTWLQQSADRWVLNYFHGAEAVGYFAVIFQLGFKPASMGAKLLTKFLAPILFEKAGDATNKNRNKKVADVNYKIVLLVLGITLIGFIGAIFLFELMFEWLVDERYQEFAYLLPYMVLAGGFYAAGQLSSLTIMSRMDSKKLMVPNIVTSLFCVSLHAVLSKYYGVAGIVYSYLIFTLVQFTWIFLIKINLNNARKNK